MNKRKDINKMKIDCSKTENYFKEKARMTKRDKKGCAIECIDCQLSECKNGEKVGCSTFQILYPQKAIEIVQKWSDEHPRETIFEHFKKILPNMDNRISSDICDFCPSCLDRNILDIDICKLENNCCIRCWNRDYEDSIKNEQT